MNWLKTSWGDYDHLSFSDKIAFNIDASGTVPTDKSPIEEAIKLVHNIVDNTPSPHYLMLSGGIDSQAMLYAWVKAGVKFIPVSFRYNKTYNSHDLYNCANFLEKFDLKTNILDIDVFSFLHDELHSYSRKYICNSPQITLHMKFVDTINDGTCVFSGNPLNLHNYGNSGSQIDYTILGLYRYSLLSGKSVVPFFFFHTPELQWAFSNNYENKTMPLIKKYDLKSYSVKIMDYMTAGFEITPTNKYSGFERYKIYYDGFKNQFDYRTLLVKYQQFPSKRLFDLLFRYPLFEINKYNTKIIWKFPKRKGHKNETPS